MHKGTLWPAQDTKSNDVVAGKRKPSRGKSRTQALTRAGQVSKPIPVNQREAKQVVCAQIKQAHQADKGILGKESQQG